MERLTIEYLPETKEIEGAKRWAEPKGEFVQISYREDIGHLALFELNKGFTRGGHYHEKKDETFYVAAGRVHAVFYDIDTKERAEKMLDRGCKVKVLPRLAHIFTGVDDALVVEYSSRYYDKNDGFPVDFEVVNG